MRLRLVALGVAAVLAFIAPASTAQAQTRAKAQRLGAPIERMRLEPAAASEVSHKQRINAWTLGLAAGRTKVRPCSLRRSLRACSMTATICASCRSSRAGHSTTSTTCSTCAASMPPSSTATCLITSRTSPNSPCFATYQLPAQPFPIRSARLCQAGDQLSPGPCRQGRQLQHARYGSKFLGSNHLQAARHRGEGDLPSAQRCHGKDAAGSGGGSDVLGIVQAPCALPEGQMARWVQVLAGGVLRQARVLHAVLSRAHRLPRFDPARGQIATISVPAVLAVFDWPRGSDRYPRLVRLVDYLFARIERLQKEPGYHEKWKDVNIAANVPGWKRFQPLQDKLDKLSGITALSARDLASAPTGQSARRRIGN